MSYTDEQPRGDRTRECLIAAGLRVFGDSGFNGASTRALAAEAGTNLAAIPYHFGNKEGLYLAVAEHVATRIDSHMRPLTDELDALAVDELSPAAARELLHRLIRALADLLMCNPETDAWAAFILREQARPTAAFEILYGGAMGRLSDICCMLIGALTGRAADDEETLIRAMTLVGQVTVFRTHRAAALRRLGRDAYDERLASAVVDAIMETIDACSIDAGATP